MLTNQKKLRIKFTTSTSVPRIVAQKPLFPLGTFWNYAFIHEMYFCAYYYVMSIL